MSQEYIRPSEAEQRYPITEGQFAQMRYMGTGPRYFKPSPKTVLYRPQDIEAWIEASARLSTAEAS